MSEASAPEARALEARALEALDLERLIDDVRALVRIASWNGQEDEAQAFMAAAMQDAGLEVDRWTLDLDALARHPAYSAELSRRDPIGLVARLEGTGGGRSLILNGHVDVVPPGDEALWSHPPFGGALVDGHVVGRGALDMKGQLVAGLHALRAIRASGVRLRGDALLMSVVGEEDGGSGTLGAIMRGHRADGAIVLEPTGFAVAPAQAGALNFRIRVPGLAAHGALREEGVSALENLMPVYRAIEDLERARNRALGGDPLFARYRTPFAICVGTVQGGDWASSVPDHVTVEGRLGVAPGEVPADAMRALEGAVADAARAHPWLRHRPPTVEWWGGRFLPARTPVDDPLVATVRDAAADTLDREVSLEGMPYGADMGLLVHEAGVPTVLFGAGDIRGAHRPDESVAVADLHALARALVRAVVRFCG